MLVYLTYSENKYAPEQRGVRDNFSFAMQKKIGILEDNENNWFCGGNGKRFSYDSNLNALILSMFSIKNKL